MPQRTARLEARISPEALAMVRRAAEIEVVTLSPEAQEQFVELLLNPQRWSQP